MALQKRLSRLDGVFDDAGKPVLDKKTKEHKVPADPQYVV